MLDDGKADNKIDGRNNGRGCTKFQKPNAHLAGRTREPCSSAPEQTAGDPVVTHDRSTERLLFRIQMYDHLV
jgi:hypothetical protein